MPIRTSFTYRTITEVVKHYGCRQIRTTGSHIQRHSPRTNKLVTIPNHGSQTIKIKTLFSIMDQAGITKEDVLSFSQKN